MYITNKNHNKKFYVSEQQVNRGKLLEELHDIIQYKKLQGLPYRDDLKRFCYIRSADTRVFLRMLNRGKYKGMVSNW